MSETLKEKQIVTEAEIFYAAEKLEEKIKAAEAATKVETLINTVEGFGKIRNTGVVIAVQKATIAMSDLSDNNPAKAGLQERFDQVLKKAD